MTVYAKDAVATVVLFVLALIASDAEKSKFQYLTREEQESCAMAKFGYSRIIEGDGNYGPWWQCCEEDRKAYADGALSCRPGYGMYASTKHLARKCTPSKIQLINSKCLQLRVPEQMVEVKYLSELGRSR